MADIFEIDGAVHSVAPVFGGPALRLDIDGECVEAVLAPLAGGEFELTIDAKVMRVFVATDGDRSFVHLDGAAVEIAHTDSLTALRRAKRSAAGGCEVTAPMPGVVVELAVAVGDRVSAGDRVAVIESMKLQTTLTADMDGIVETVAFDVGQNFDSGAVLVTLAAEDG